MNEAGSLGQLLHAVHCLIGPPDFSSSELMAVDATASPMRVDCASLALFETTEHCVFKES